VFDMARVVQANLICFHCRRTLDSAATPQTRERAEQALRSLVGRTITRRLVDDMVAAES